MRKFSQIFGSALLIQLLYEACGAAKLWCAEVGGRSAGVLRVLWAEKDRCGQRGKNRRVGVDIPDRHKMYLDDLIVYGFPLKQPGMFSSQSELLSMSQWECLHFQVVESIEWFIEGQAFLWSYAFVCKLS
jgi:hypothetical protein